MRFDLKSGDVELPSLTEQPTWPSSRDGVPLELTRASDGALMLGRYRLGAILGEGGMGVVYRAVDHRTGWSVALKVMRRCLLDDPSWDAEARFAREAEVAATFVHPNLVRTVDYGRARLPDGASVPFMGLELVDGVSLARFARSANGWLTLRALAQVTAAVEHLGDRNLAHRDVHSRNVLVTPAGRCVLIDLGLARPIVDRHSSAAERIVGTLRYMSPERIRGEPEGHKSDVFSLGVLVYECLVGAPLFEAPFAAYQLPDDFPATIEWPESVRAWAPPELFSVVAGMLAPSPSLRWTAREARRGLERVLAARGLACNARIPQPRLRSLSPSVGRRGWPTVRQRSPLPAVLSVARDPCS